MSFPRHVVPSLARYVTAVLTLALTGCYTYSSFQSARLLREGEFSATPCMSFHTMRSGDNARWVTSQFGARGAAGLAGAEMLNLTAGYERIEGHSEAGGRGLEYNYLEGGFKLGLVRDHLAFAMPVGLLFGGDINSSANTWQVQPGLIATVPLGGPLVDLNLAAKTLFFFDKDADNLLACNAGLGIRPLPQLTVLPEAGLLFDPGEDGYFTYFGLGLSFKFGAPLDQ